jgi:hypothetical protein
MSNLPPSPNNPEYQVPVPQPQQGTYPPHPHQMEGDATGGLIPYKNPPALIAYYLGVFSIVIPFLGIASVVMGFFGLSKHKSNPLVRGKGHAITGIVLGLLTAIGWLALILAIRNAF